MSDCRLVMITWLDSRQANGAWQWLSDYEKMQPVEVVSVGWLIQDDDVAKVLAQSMAPDGENVQTSGRKVIPARCVTKIENLIEDDDKPKDESRAIGGRARAAALSPERRTEIARQAADARWGKTPVT